VAPVRIDVRLARVDDAHVDRRIEDDLVEGDRSIVGDLGGNLLGDGGRAVVTNRAGLDEDVARQRKPVGVGDAKVPVKLRLAPLSNRSKSPLGSNAGECWPKGQSKSGADAGKK
jgi:hypothetical protein